MMDPRANVEVMEQAFNESLKALEICASKSEGAGQDPWQYFPASGTLLTLLRYGELVGRFPDGQVDVVDKDLDFFILSPANQSAAWESKFTPCLERELMAATTQLQTQRREGRQAVQNRHF